MKRNGACHFIHLALLPLGIAGSAGRLCIHLFVLFQAYAQSSVVVLWHLKWHK